MLAEGKFPWNEQSLARAAELGAKRYSGGQIAQVLSEEYGCPVTRNAVISKMTRNSLPFGRLPVAGAKRHRRSDAKTKITKAELAQRLQNNAPGRVLRGLGPPEFAAVPIPNTPAPTGFLGLQFSDLRAGHCRFPRGDGPFLFCGQPQKKGSSYCDECHARCWRQPPKSISAEERRERRRLAKQVHGVMGRVFA